MLGQTGEYLTWSNANLELEPRLAEKWEPNEDGSVWTFTIREGVTFNDGTPMTTEDVAATFDRLVDPQAASNALSALGGILTPGNTAATDERTVEFRLEAPVGGFPYLVSSDNYNAIILPASYDGDYESSFIGTGPWKLDSFEPKARVSFVKNPDYWNTERPPNADRIELVFFAEEQASVLALQGGEVDALSHFSVANGSALLSDPDVNVTELQAAVHRQMHMRTDKEPFTDKRVRQAMALLIDRQALVDGLFEGKADLGNDSPFAPVYPTTDTSVEQRTVDVEQARQLLADAGKADGFEVELASWRGFEIPQLAQLVQDARAGGRGHDHPQITDPGTYYGDGVYGKSRWLDSVLGITDYGHRGVPNVFLGAPLESSGTWNSAHFKNPEYDSLVAEYTAALDVDAQRTAAGKIQQLLLDETPVIFPYFYYFLTATKKNVAGPRHDGDGPCRSRGSRPHRLTESGSRGGAAPAPPRLAPGPGYEPVMGRFLLKRLGLALVTLWLLSVVVFVGAQVLPGDVARRILGPFASEEQVAALNEELGTDRSLVVQYGDWVTGVLTGDLGESLAYRRPVTELLGPALVNSAKLALLAFVLVVPLGILGGVLAALKEGRLGDRVISIGGLSLAVVPEFVDLDRPDPRVRALARRPPDDGLGAARLGPADPARVPDPAGPRARPRPLRLHRADGAGRHDRGARRRLHADGRPQGAAAAHGRPPPRAAQRPPPDDRRHRDAGGLPDRRARRNRADLQLPGARPSGLHRCRPA